jgi:hypothetical protein
VVLGIDETIEQRRGKQIAAAGIYRDPVRSSHSHFVKVRGLRWICLMLLVPIPWAGRVWALPFLSVLAPSERATKRRNRRFKPLTTWARQMIRQVHRWQPDRALVVVGDRTYAALELLDAVRSVATVVTRLRLDARLFAPAPPRLPHQQGRPRLVGERLPNLTQLAQDVDAQWAPLVVSRWYGEADRRVEVLSRTAVWYSTGFPTGADPLGTHPRSARHLRHPGAAVYRSGCASAADPRLVRSSLAGRSDVPRSARPPGRRNAAPVDRARHPADDTCPVGSLLVGDCAGTHRAVPLLGDAPPSRVVCQAISDLR